ncbi:RNA polymerase II C-terminal domain kinase beta subunit [Spiromyces aspiralis]|uniref:RNA polymerase II C-terminal domain kinase beta subunit n=1 Tax=Spiromyces aspiralis TaxID=68401 RepID=A0ACC1HEU4_9FUNG|nr:RNA polymerase II C-terminal domain kinase beta subunit [Spiromyces aspiralis]
MSINRIMDTYKLPYMRKARKNCVLITQAARKLGFPTRTYCTAQMVNYKVYTNHQEAMTHNSLYLATCSLFVASKMEETIKRIRDIVGMMYAIEMSVPDAEDIDGGVLDRIRGSVLSCEEFVLEAIGFDFRTSQAHRTYIKVAKMLKVKKELAEIGWHAFTDCYQTLLPLQYPPIVLISASICLAWNLERLEEGAETQDVFEEVIGEHWDRGRKEKMVEPETEKDEEECEEGGGGEQDMDVDEESGAEKGGEDQATTKQGK